MLQNQLPPVVQKFIATSPKYRGRDVKIDTTPYWSTVRFQFTLAGVLAVSSRQAFSYAIGSDRTPAGFTGLAAADNLATMADTNLQKAGETRLNADIFVAGVSACVMPTSEGSYLKRVFRECAVTISTDGQNTAPLAPLEHLPAGGGLQGSMPSAIKEPPFDTAGIVDGGGGTLLHFAQNGLPMAGNFLMLHAPVLWTGQQGVDSNFRLNFDIGRSITEAVAAARVAAAGIAAYTPPAAIGDAGTFVDVRVALANYAISLLSVNG